MSFEFSFEKLLEHKRTLENIARREWVEAQTKVDNASAEMKRMYDVIEDSRKMVASLSAQGGAHAPHMASIDTFINGQKIRIERQRHVIRDLMMEAETRHEALKAAAVERKTLEKLKERKFAEFKLARKKRELKEVDELVTTRFKPAGSDS